HEQLLELIRDIQARPGAAVVLFPGPGERRGASRPKRGLIRPLRGAPRPWLRGFPARLRSFTPRGRGGPGPMHLAAAVGVPTVTMFHTSKARSYAPRGPLDRAVQVEGAWDIESVRRAVRDALAGVAGRAAAMELASRSSPPAAR